MGDSQHKEDRRCASMCKHRLSSAIYVASVSEGGDKLWSLTYQFALADKGKSKAKRRGLRRRGMGGELLTNRGGEDGFRVLTRQSSWGRHCWLILSHHWGARLQVMSCAWQSRQHWLMTDRFLFHVVTVITAKMSQKILFARLKEPDSYCISVWYKSCYRALIITAVSR